MELWKNLITSKALASDQDSSEGIVVFYNLKVRFILKLNKVEAKATKLARSHLL